MFNSFYAVYLGNTLVSGNNGIIYVDHVPLTGGGGSSATLTNVVFQTGAQAISGTKTFFDPAILYAGGNTLAPSLPSGITNKFYVDNVSGALNVKINLITGVQGILGVAHLTGNETFAGNKDFLSRVRVTGSYSGTPIAIDYSASGIFILAGGSVFQTIDPIYQILKDAVGNTVYNWGNSTFNQSTTFSSTATFDDDTFFNLGSQFAGNFLIAKTGSFNPIVEIVNETETFGIYDTTGNAAIDVNKRSLTGDWSINDTFKTQAGIIRLYSTTGGLIYASDDFSFSDESQLNSIGFGSRILADNQGYMVLSWQDKVLNNSGVSNLDWAKKTLIGDWTTNTIPTTSGHIINKSYLDSQTGSLSNAVVIRNTKSGKNIYYSIPNEDNRLRGDALLQANAESVNGDCLNLMVGRFDLGSGYLNLKSGVSLFGKGMGATVITSSGASVSGAILCPSTNGVISDVFISGTAILSATQWAVGLLKGSQSLFNNAKIYNSRFKGVKDSFYVQDGTFQAGAYITADFYNCIFESSFDQAVFESTVPGMSGAVNFYGCKFQTTEDSISGVPMRGIYASNGAFEIKIQECDIDIQSPYPSSSKLYGILNDAFATNFYVNSSRIKLTSPNNKHSVDNTNNGRIYLNNTELNPFLPSGNPSFGTGIFDSIIITGRNNYISGNNTYLFGDWSTNTSPTGVDNLINLGYLNNTSGILNSKFNLSTGIILNKISILTGETGNYYSKDNPSGFINVIASDVVRTTGIQTIVGAKTFTTGISVDIISGTIFGNNVGFNTGRLYAGNVATIDWANGILTGKNWQTNTVPTISGHVINLAYLTGVSGALTGQFGTSLNTATGTLLGRIQTLQTATGFINTNPSGFLISGNLDQQFSQQTGNYSITFGDRNKTVEINYTGIGNAIVTFSGEPFVMLPTGAQGMVYAYGTGLVNITGGPGVTIRSQGSGYRLNGQYAGLTWLKRTSGEYVIFGNMV